MDMKRFNEITWQEAIVKWSNGEQVFSSTGHTYYMKDDALHFLFGNESNGGESTAFFNDIAKMTWYIKKPFDVRTEMLARPNEWVGAYEWKGKWFKVRFNDEVMRAEEYNLSNGSLVAVAWVGGLDLCIPIEDVPKEEL